MTSDKRRMTGWAGGLDELEEKTCLSHPPQRALRTDDGQTVFEDQTLVGYVIAPQSAKAQLDLYGIDMSYATFDRLNGRWAGCFFSEQVADILVELTKENQFPYPFEARPSWAELDWKVRQQRGETEQPSYSVYLYCEPASQEAIDVWQKRTGEQLVRRGAGSDRAELMGDPDPGFSTVWTITRKDHQS